MRPAHVATAAAVLSVALCLWVLRYTPPEPSPPQSSAQPPPSRDDPGTSARTSQQAEAGLLIKAPRKVVVERRRLREALASPATVSRAQPVYRRGALDGLRLRFSGASPLADLGLRDGDELISVDGEPLGSTARLLALSRGLQRRHRVVLGVRRGDARWQLTVVFADGR